MIRIETHPTSEVGKCMARQCPPTQVLVIIAGKNRMVLCEQCFSDMVRQSELYMLENFETNHKEER